MFKKAAIVGADMANHFIRSRQFRIRCWGMLFILLMILLLIPLFTPLQSGLIATYYTTVDWSGKPLLTVREKRVNLWRMKSVYPEFPENYSIEWNGVIYISRSGKYQFLTRSDDGSELSIGNRLVVDNRGFHGIEERSGSIFLEQGFYPIRIRYMQGSKGAELNVSWIPRGSLRQRISDAPLFVTTPTETVFFIGRSLVLLFSVAKYLLLLGLLFIIFVGLSNRHLLLSHLKNSFPGQYIVTFHRFVFDSTSLDKVVPKPPKKHGLTLLFVFIGYTVLSLIWTYPLLIKFSTEMPGLGGDRYIYLWNMWWMKKALFDLQANPLYTDYLFYPKGIELSFHDFSIFNSLLSVPLQNLFTLKEIYNLLFLSTFVFGGFGCFLLLRYLTGSSLAGFISGVIFAFWGGRAYYVEHLSLVSIQWFPYYTLFLLKTLRERSYRNPVLAAIFLTVNALSAWYYAIYMSLFTGLFLLYFVWTDRTTVLTFQYVKRLFLLALVFTLLMLPFLVPMLSQIIGGEEYMVSKENALASASLNVLLFPNINHGFMGKYVRYLYVRNDLPLQWGLAGGAFIGYVTIFLCLYTAIRLRHLKLGGWFLILLVSLIVSFGPHPVLFSKVYKSIPLPYQLLQYLPILNIIRIPIRFMVLVMFCSSVLAGYACWDIFRRVRLKNFIFLCFSVLILFESFRYYYIRPTESIPQFYQQLHHDHEDYAILEITKLFNWQHSSVRASLFQTKHEKKLFHGHVSRVPQEKYRQAYALYSVFNDLFMLPAIQSQIVKDGTNPYFEATVDTSDLLDILSFYNVRYITLYPDYWYGDFHNNYLRLQAIFGKSVDADPGLAIFKVPPTHPSHTRIFPGEGMYPLSVSDHEPARRQTASDADMYILNIENSQKLYFQFEGKSFTLPEEQVEISINGMLISTITVGDWTEVVLPELALQPGENIIHFRTLDNGNWKYGIQLRKIRIHTLE